jgi:hypothetical protein
MSDFGKTKEARTYVNASANKDSQSEGSARQKKEKKSKVFQRCTHELYSDFGPSGQNSHLLSSDYIRRFQTQLKTEVFR